MNETMLCSCPTERKKIAKIEVLTALEIKEEAMKFVPKENTPASVELKRWIKQYTKESQAREENR